MKVARPLPPLCRFTKTPLLSGVGTRRPFAQARGVRSTLASMPAGHVSRVRALYRGILLLHRGLPPDLKALGDQYVKDEFRRHKTVGSDEAQRFLQEWEVYAAVLWQQTNENRQNSTERVCFGVALPEEKLNDFRDEQIGQLQELMQEATKPNRQFSIPESRKPEF